MQLAKTSAKLAQFSEGGGLYIPILTDPTTGGVTASYGMLGDLDLQHHLRTAPEGSQAGKTVPLHLLRGR